MDMILIDMEQDLNESAKLIAALIKILDFGKADAKRSNENAANGFGEFSDVFIESGRCITARRRNRDVVRVSEGEVAADAVEAFCQTITGTGSIGQAIIERQQKEGKAEFEGVIEQQDYRLRYSICFAERIADSRAKDNESARLSISFRRYPFAPVPLASIGYPKKVIDQVSNVMMSRNGLAVVSGPTSSGKTITCAALIREIVVHSARRIVTIEQPTEIPQPSLGSPEHAQTGEPALSHVLPREVGARGGPPTFMAGLDAAKRQNPDMIFVGEVRTDPEVQAVTEAGGSGVFVLTTLHANGPVGAIQRLIEATKNPELISRTLGLVIHQVIVPKKELQEFDDGTSYSSSQICADVFVIPDEARKLIAERKYDDLQALFRKTAEESNRACTMNETLRALVKSSDIDRQTALSYSSDREHLGI